MVDDITWPKSAHLRQLIVRGHLALSTAGALVASIVVIEAPSVLAAFVLFLVAIWVAVSELANAVDVRFDLAWAADDGTPRRRPWSEVVALRIGLRLHDWADRLAHPAAPSHAGTGRRIEVMEIEEIPEELSRQ